MKFEKAQVAQKNRYMICQSPEIMRKVLMLIHGGRHPINSLVETFRDYETESFIGPASIRFVSELQAGLPMEGVILNFNLAIQYKPLARMLQRILLYEKTGNILLLEQLDQDLIRLGEDKYGYLLESMNRADLMSMLPSLIHLMLLMVLLMSPILLGGTLI